MITYPRALPAGDSGWTIEFGDAIEPALNARTIAFARAVEALRFPGVSDIVPTYRSATIYFDPLAVDPLPFRQRLLSLAETTTGTTAGAMRTVIIPVLYGWTEGPDLEELAASAQLSIPEVIARHISVEYRVYMLGFSPGFPYMGVVPASIAAPRLAEPRQHVPAGSVGIAGSQTGIYPQDSPGGWRLIGRTPVRVYDPTHARPFLFEPGDGVWFVEIDRREFDRLSAQNKEA